MELRGALEMDVKQRVVDLLIVQYPVRVPSFFGIQGAAPYLLIRPSRPFPFFLPYDLQHV